MGYDLAMTSDSNEQNDIDSEGARLRGRAVEMFGEFERTLDSVISGYYVRRHPLSTYFILDVLCAEGFSYGLRRSIFESIVRRHGWFESARMAHLHKVGRWRNFLAHVAGMETHDYGDDELEPKVGYRDPKYPHRTLTIAEAFDCFKKECEGANNYVNDVRKRVTPTRKNMTPGHVIEDPVPEHETYEAWVNAPLFGEEFGGDKS